MAELRKFTEIEAQPVRRLRDIDLPSRDDSPHNVRWQEFHTVRNSVLEVLEHFGTVGPMRQAQITDDKDGPPSPWPTGDQDPDFFVVDDMWNDWDRFIKVELKSPAALKSPVLQRLRTVLAKKHPQWAVGLATEKGYLLVSATAFLAKGPAYRACKTVADILRVCVRHG